MKGNRIHSKELIELCLIEIALGMTINKTAKLHGVCESQLRAVLKGEQRTECHMPEVLIEWRNTTQALKTFLKGKKISQYKGLPKLKKVCSLCMFYDRKTDEYGECMKLDPVAYKDQTVHGSDVPCSDWRSDERVKEREFYE